VLPYFLFCFAKKESSKEKRRFFAKGSAGKKKAIRCFLKLYSATWRWLSAYRLLLFKGINGMSLKDSLISFLNHIYGIKKAPSNALRLSTYHQIS
jgi:hypothetical protein